MQTHLKKISILAMALVIFGAGLLIGLKLSKTSSEVEVEYAKFNGGSITGKDVLPLVKDEIAGCENQIRESKIRVTTEKVKQALLEAEAKKKGLSPNDLLSENRKQIESGEIPKEKLAAFLATQGRELKSLSPKEKETVTKLMQAKIRMSADQIFIDDLFKNAAVKVTVP